MSSTPELAARLDSPGRVRSGLGSPSDNAIDDEECEPSVGIENMSKRFGQREMGLALKGPIQQIIAFPFVPEMRPLTIQDIDSCIALENASFDEHYRCTPEKVRRNTIQCSGFAASATTDAQARPPY